jgi:hypothetical protein
LVSTISFDQIVQQIDAVVVVLVEIEDFEDALVVEVVIDFELAEAVE